MEVDLEAMNVVLNFHIPEFDRKTSSNYKLILENVDSKEEIATVSLNASAFVVSLVKDNTNSYYRKDRFGENYEVEYVLFVEKSKNDLNQSIRSYEEMNPSNQYNTEPKMSKSVSNYEAVKLMSVGEISKRASIMHEPSLGRRQPRRMNELFESIEEPQNQTTSIVAT